jgi:ABC-type phosphate transport system substrate-binding protein
MADPASFIFSLLDPISKAYRYATRPTIIIGVNRDQRRDYYAFNVYIENKMDRMVELISFRVNILHGGAYRNVSHGGNVDIKTLGATGNVLTVTMTKIYPNSFGYVSFEVYDSDDIELKNIKTDGKFEVLKGRPGFDKAGPEESYEDWKRTKNS